MYITSDGLQSDAERCTSGTNKCKCTLSQVSALEASVSSTKDNFGKLAETVDCLKRCVEPVDGESEGHDESSAAVRRKRKRTKTEEPMSPAR
jgi:hypothetical protein